MKSRLLRIQDWEALARKANFNSVLLASLCGVSLRQLQRFFHRKIQKTPAQWLRQLQCLMAAELLARGYSTKQVAAELKFGDATHFCREFKKSFGVSPGNFVTGMTPLKPDVVFRL